MKNKKIWIPLGIALLTSLNYSCSKEEPLREDSQSLEIKGNKMLLPGQTPGTLNSASIYYSGGLYRTAYAGGLIFGDEFIHPTNKFDYQMYTPWQPVSASQGVSGLNNLLSYQQNGHKFVVLLGTSPGGFVTSFDSDKYWEDLDKGQLNPIRSYFTLVGGDANGIITITGKFMIDHNAALGVSIFAVDAPEDGAGPPPVVGIE